MWQCYRKTFGPFESFGPFDSASEPVPHSAGGTEVRQHAPEVQDEEPRDERLRATIALNAAGDASPRSTASIHSPILASNTSAFARVMARKTHTFDPDEWVAGDRGAEDHAAPREKFLIAAGTRTRRFSSWTSLRN